jgi:salicylate hydroxylase
MADGPEQEARDKLFLSQLGKELNGPFPSRWTCPQVQPWLYGYDAHEEVREAMREKAFGPSKAEFSTKTDGFMGWFSSIFRWAHLQFQRLETKV